MKPARLSSAFGLFAVILTSLFCLADEGKVYSKRTDLPLRQSASETAKTVAKAAWNEELKVLEKTGRWLKVAAADGEGWVYSGNIAPEKLPEENRNEMPGKSSGLTAATAGRGWTDGSEHYAQEHDLGDTAEKIKWAEKLNRSISADQARDYLKSHRLGEYAEAK